MLRLVAGSVLFEGVDIARLSTRALQRLRGNRISFVPQNPTTALNPAMTVGDQIAEVLKVHKGLSGAAVAQRFAALMEQVGLAAIPDIGERYPHRLSGGQQQRIAIAMALACEPDLMVLDEPTTGLDVTVQAQIISLLKSLRHTRGLSMVYVTHDLPLLRQIADRLGVMQRGVMVEIGGCRGRCSRDPGTLTRAICLPPSRSFNWPTPFVVRSEHAGAHFRQCA